MNTGESYCFNDVKNSIKYLIIDDEEKGIFVRREILENIINLIFFEKNKSY